MQTTLANRVTQAVAVEAAERFSKVSGLRLNIRLGSKEHTENLTTTTRQTTVIS
ncbi:hypothetical protein PI125_g19431 [Phytophthora idaei]|nr:hypothetical protein PI125_g19431 [Phytophthora idaei]